MANINLATNQSAPITQREIAARSGILSVLAIFFVTALTYGGLIMWEKDLNKKVVDANGVYNKRYSDLTSGQNVEVTDLQNRIFTSKELISKDNVLVSVLENIEKSMVSGVYIRSYSSNKDTKSIVLECVADSYDSVAKQLLSFKESKYFSSASIQNAATNEGGTIGFAVNIKFK